MEIDNFDRILPFFTFDEKDFLFFHLQICKRAKDQTNGRGNEGYINYYFVKSAEALKKMKNEVVSICNALNARAYINLSPKSLDKVQKMTLIKLAQYNADGTIIDPKRIVNQAAGGIKGNPKRWIIDVDDVSYAEEIKNSIFELLKKRNTHFDANGNAIENDIYIREFYPIVEIPTKNGIHFITPPFDSKAFNELCIPDVSIHENSMGTVLYIPDLKQN